MCLNNTNAVGYDELPTKLIKKCAGVISFPLCHLVNISMVEGIFPKSLKKSILIPLYKKGNQEDPNNYRPVSLIPVLSKIFEKVVYNRVYNYLDKFNILKNEQNGFRKNKSTTLACFNLIDIVTRSLDEKNTTGILLLDMTKAFDMVNHHKLLFKLKKYGIRGPALDWLHSYLNDRSQCTEISRTEKSIKQIYRSNFRLNTCGVPQGSILGPLLFLLYINDLPDATSQKSILFADDATIIIKSNKDQFEFDINTALNNIITWLDDNDLQINLNKTKFIQFKTYKTKLLNPNINYNGSVIEEVTESNFLGITLDSFCNWKSHIDIISYKINKFIYVIWRLRQTVSEKVALMAYHGYVASILRYGIVLWGNSVNKDIPFKAQKKCLRVLTGAAYDDTCKPLFKKLNLLSVPCMYIYELAVFVKLNPELFTTLGEICPRLIRRKGRLVIPKTNLTLRNKGPYNMAVRIYNKIPDGIKQLPIHKFKNNMKKMLINKCYYNINEYLNDNSL